MSPSCFPAFLISSVITLLNAKDDAMNFHDLQVWHYAVAGCGVLLLLAIILYFIPGGRINISGTAACGLRGVRGFATQLQSRGSANLFGG